MCESIGSPPRHSFLFPYNYMQRVTCHLEESTDAFYHRVIFALGHLPSGTVHIFTPALYVKHKKRYKT